MTKKSHLVFVPFPAMGHLVSTIEFAKLLVKQHEHLSITVLLIPAPFDHAVDSYTHSLTSPSSSSLSQRLTFTLLPTPHHHPHGSNTDNNNNPTHPASIIDSLIESHKKGVREAVSNLISDHPDRGPLTGFVLDMFTTSMIDVANELGDPSVVFFVCSAAYLGFVLHIHAIMREREDHVDTTTSYTFKDLGSEFFIPSFLNLVPASVFTEAVLDKEWGPFFLKRTNELRRVKCIVVNTFEELEPHALHSFRNTDFKVYPVGPLLKLGVGEERNDNYKMFEGGSKSNDVMEWLNHQPHSSVLFLCFGSRGCFEDVNQLKEIARALEASGVHFLWSVRKPPSDSKSVPGDYDDVAEVLPKGFLERTAGLGRVIGWAPQAQILAHEAVGGYVSHCGWNSILESMYIGVPIATWPLFSDNEMNAFVVVKELKLGVEISLDYRMGFGNVARSGVINAESIEKGIRQVMEKDSELRRKVKLMSQISRKALMEGGSSYNYLGLFVIDILNCG